MNVAIALAMFLFMAHLTGVAIVAIVGRAAVGAKLFLFSTSTDFHFVFRVCRSVRYTGLPARKNGGQCVVHGQP